MSGPADIQRFPPPAVVDPKQLPPVTSNTQGAMTAAQHNKVEAATLASFQALDATVAKVASVDLLATTAVPAFVANAASIAPGTDKSSEYTIEAARTLSNAATLTVSTANSPRQGNKYLNCHALALGYAISVVNGGAAAGTIATIDASLTKGVGVALWFDGTNYFFNGYYEIG